MHSLGCNSNGLNFFTISSIYKKFSQSIFYYGLETNYIRKECIKKLNIRQNILIKNTLGLSRYCKTTPLLFSLKIKSILQLYEEYKILFLKQINQNILTKNIYSFLVAKYEIVNPPRESYFNILKKICEKYNLQYLNLNVSLRIVFLFVFLSLLLLTYISILTHSLLSWFYLKNSFFFNM